MDESTVASFVRCCMHYALDGYLNLSNNQMVCLLKECLILAHHFEDERQAMCAHFNLGRAFLNSANYHEALHHLQESLKIALQFNDMKVQRAVFINLGDAYRSLGNYQKSIEYEKQGLEITKELGYKKDEQSTYAKIADAYMSLGDYSQAIENYEKSLEITLDLENKSADMKTYEKLGEAFLALGNPTEALENFKKCLKIAQELNDQVQEGHSYVNIGDVYLETGEYKEAIMYYKKGETIALATGDRYLEVRICSNVGNVFVLTSDYRQAEEYFEKSLKNAKLLGDKQEQGRTVLNLGVICSSLGKYQEAIGHFKTAVSIAKETHYKNLEARATVNLAQVLSTIGEYHDAIKCILKSLDLSLKVNDKKAEETAYMNLGSAYLSLGRYTEAHRYLVKASKMTKELNDRKGEGMCNIFLGNVFLSLAKFQEAINKYETSLAITREIGDKNGERLAYMNLGNTYLSLQETEKAIGYYKKSLKVAQEIGNKNGEGASLMSLGNSYSSLDKDQEALEYFEKSLAVAKAIGDKKGEGTTYINLGNAYFSLHNYEEASNFFKLSLNLAKTMSDKRNEAIANHDLGKLCYYLSDKHAERSQDLKQQSINYLKESVRSWEWVIENLQKRDDFMISIIHHFNGTYKMLTTVLSESGNTEEALLVCDRGRARALGDILASKYGINPTASTPLGVTDLEEVSSKCNACIVYFAFLEKGLGIWIIRKGKPISFTECNSKFFCFSTQILWIKNFRPKENLPFLEVLSNVYKMQERKPAMCENRSLNLFATCRQISNNNQHVADERPSTERNGTSTDEGPSTERNGTPTDEVPSTSEQQAVALGTLFDQLIGPILQHLEQQDIIIIPDRHLFEVPFAALRDPSGRFLCETKSIRIAPSLATLGYLQECPADSHCDTGALVIGNPHVGEVKLREEIIIIDTLPYAEHEANIIGNILNAKPLIGSQATKEMVKNKLREGVAVIHIAAHGDSEHGHIILAPPPRTHAASIPEEQDYMLTMEEVQEIGVTAQLVVLSCCHSGRGDIKAEGVVGMSRAFLAAGARAVVASLWAIKDEATLSFMVSFYECLKMGESAGKSLQRAMKELQEEGYDEPRYWAPFFLIGDDVTISV